MYKRDDKIRKYHITYLNRIGNSLKCNSTKIVKLGRLGCRLCTNFLSWYRYNGEDDEVVTITSGSQMYYSDESLNDMASPDGTVNETLPLSHFVNAEIYLSVLG